MGTMIYFTVCVCTFHFIAIHLRKTMPWKFSSSAADWPMNRAKMTKATSGRLESTAKTGYATYTFIK